MNYRGKVTYDIASTCVPLGCIKSFQHVLISAIYNNVYWATITINLLRSIAHYTFTRSALWNCVKARYPKNASLFFRRNFRALVCPAVASILGRKREKFCPSEHLILAIKASLDMIHTTFPEKYQLDFFPYTLCKNSLKMQSIPSIYWVYWNPKVFCRLPKCGTIKVF